MKLGFPLLPPGIHRIKIGSGTRLASGMQAITGVGFRPKIVIFLGTALGGVNRIESIGFDDGVTAYSLLGVGQQVDGMAYTLASVLAQKDVTNYISGHVESMDADGFTIHWTLVGAVTISFIYLALR